jgi:hypothetical protein
MGQCKVLKETPALRIKEALGSDIESASEPFPAACCGELQLLLYFCVLVKRKISRST